MEFEDIANLVNRVAIERKGRPLKDVERIVLKGAWENQTYSTMATLAVGYTEDYLKKDVGPKLWRLLSEIIDQQGIKVTKRNIQNVLQHWATESTSVVPSSTRIHEPELTGSTHEFTASLPSKALTIWHSPRIDVTDFCGRQSEVTQLTQWIQSEGCRLLVLWGLQGVGKTALAAKVAEQLAVEVDICGYLKLVAGVTVHDFLDALAIWLTTRLGVPAPDQPNLDWVLQQFSQYCCLLIVDQGEQLFAEHQLAGTYRPEAEDIQLLFRQVGELNHRSCLFWLGREKPADLALLRGGRVREYYLDDLPLEDIKTMLSQHGQFNASAADWQALEERYGGSPLLLKSLASTIQDVYQRQVKPFLNEPQLTIPRDLRQGLEQTLSRLSAGELDILYWLALAHEPVPLSVLSESIRPTPSAAVVQSLLGRSLCCLVSTTQEESTTLTLKPIVRATVIEQLLPVLIAELQAERFDRLNRMPLINMSAREVVQARQQKNILKPLVVALQRLCPSEQAISEKFMRLHQVLRATCIGQPGYGAGNFIHLCQQLDISISGVDFSGLTIWHSDLRQMSLQGANFSQAQFADTVFATALGRNPRAAFSQNGQYMATGDHEGRLLLWERKRGKLERVLDAGGSQSIHALAFSPQGDVLAVGTESGQIWLWPLTAMYQADGLFDHEASVRAIAFSPDGLWLASGDDTGKICLWELASGICHGQFMEHQGPIHSLVFSPQGNLLVSGGDDQQACLWDVRQKTLVRQFQGSSTAWVRTAGFLPDPANPDALPIPYAAGYDEHCLTIWDIAAGRPCWILPVDVHALPAMALSPDGRYLVCSRQDHTVAVWDIPSRLNRYTLHTFDSPVWTLVFSPDSRYFVTGNDYTIKLWSSRTGACSRSLLSQAHPVRCLAFNGDSSKLLTGHDDARLRLWQLNGASAFASCPRNLDSHNGSIRAVTVSEDSQWFASSAEDHTIRLWHGDSGQCQQVFGNLQLPPALMAFSPDNRWLVSAGEDALMVLWDLNTGRPAYHFEGHDAAISSLAFTPDGQYLLSGSRDCTIRLWEVSTGNCLSILAGHQGQVHSLAISPDSTVLASASHDGTIRWWDLATWGELGRWHHPEGHWLHRVMLDPNSEILAISSNFSNLEVWAAKHNQCRHLLVGHTHDIWQVFVSPDRRYIATASQDDEIRVWQLDLGSCQQVLRPDRPYEGVNIRGASGLSEPETTMIRSMGAIVGY
jgi:WD40 repeat protein